ncbi:hypothetical protein JY465_04245 [Stenotrophomonas maltophilia]|nr:hypothetical protein [Stenotrophomonas maltophilia]
MNRVAWIEDRLAEAQVSLDRHRQAVAGSSSLISKLALRSMETHVSELRHDLHVAKAEHGKQLISLRLSGTRLNDGSIPLHLLSRLASLMERTMSYASYRIQKGKEATRKIPEEVRRLLDLRLADVAMGSTELVITGNTAPDLAGDSVLERSLLAVLAVLNSSADEVAANASVAGSMASRMVELMLKELEAEGCSVDLKWVDSADRIHQWQATPLDVTAVRQNLLQVSVGHPERIVVRGVVELLSSRGRIEVLSFEGQKIAATFPSELFDNVRRLRLGQDSTFTFTRTVTTNARIGQTVEAYSLVGFVADNADGSMEYLPEHV